MHFNTHPSVSIQRSIQILILDALSRGPFILSTLILSPLLEHKLLQFSIRILQIIVNNDQIMNPWCLRVFELIPCLSETLLDRLLFLGASAAETLFEDIHRGRC